MVAHFQTPLHQDLCCFKMGPTTPQAQSFYYALYPSLQETQHIACFNTTHPAVFTNSMPIQPHQCANCLQLHQFNMRQNLQKSLVSHFRKHLVCILNSALLNCNQHNTILYCCASTKTSNKR